MTNRLIKTPSVQPVSAPVLLAHPRANEQRAARAEPARFDVAPVNTIDPAAEALAREQALVLELDQLRAAAREDGLRQGLREAKAEIELAKAREQAQLHALVRDVNAAVDDRLLALEDFAVAIAFEACGAVLTQAAVDGQAVITTVRRLIEPFRQAGLLRIQLHPEDLQRVRQALLADPHPPNHPPRFEADASLSRGECRVVTPHGQLESSLEVQLAAIRDNLVATHAQLQVSLETLS